MTFPMTLLEYQKALFALNEVLKAQHRFCRRGCCFRTNIGTSRFSAVFLCAYEIKGLAEAVIKAVVELERRGWGAQLLHVCVSCNNDGLLLL